MKTHELTSLTLNRRANAKIANVALLSTFGGLFATVPMSIRQKDWRLWVLPGCAAFFLGFISAYADTEGEKAVYTLAGWVFQGGVCTVLVKGNKEDAKEFLAQS